MDYTKEIVDSIKPLLKQYGFSKNKLNWFWEDQDILKVFNIQKSLYGQQIYLNIGIKIKALETTLSYSFPGSHIAFRLDHLFSKGILAFENNVDNSTRCSEIMKIINSNPYDFFTLTGSEENIIQFVKLSGTLAINVKAKEYLQIDKKC